MLTADQVHAIHATNTKAVLAITGGGTDAIGNLLRFGGGSATLLEAVVPYDQQAFRNFVGGKPDKYCAPVAARDLAMGSYIRAKKLAPNHTVVGIGATCSLAKDGEERAGRRHQAFLALQTQHHTITRTIEYPQGNYKRAEEEEITSEQILGLLAAGCGIDITKWNPGRFLYETAYDRIPGRAPWHGLIEAGLAGRPEFFVESLSDPKPTSLFFPGSFNPLHPDHENMATVAAEITGMPLNFEISVYNVEKPPLNFHAIAERLRGLKEKVGNKPWVNALFLTNTPRFDQKAALLPNSTFVVGFDTIERVGNPKFYADEKSMLAAWRELESLGSKFLVFHRKRDGVTSTQADFDKIDARLRTLCQLVSSDKFTPQGYASSDIRRAKDE